MWDTQPGLECLGGRAAVCQGCRVSLVAVGARLHVGTPKGEGPVQGRTQNMCLALEAGGGQSHSDALIPVPKQTPTGGVKVTSDLKIKDPQAGVRGTGAIRGLVWAWIGVGGLHFGAGKWVQVGVQFAP